MPTASRGAIIVGASSGIGAALARELAGRGYTLALLARREDALTALSASLRGSTSPIARVYAHDVTDYAAVPGLIERIATDMGSVPLSALIYGAGIMPLGQDDVWSFDEQRAMIETNTIGAMAWLDAGAGALRARGGGTLVGLSSVAGDRGRKGNSAYQASKAALSVYLESLRYRLAGTNVRVVTIKPGFVATAMTAEVKTPKALTARPELVARRIAVSLDGGAEVVYAPGYWRGIMGIVRALPGAVMKRTSF
jgi:short-subunit dehydrogenase